VVLPLSASLYVYIALVSFLLGRKADFDFLSAESRRRDRDSERVRSREMRGAGRPKRMKGER
jgi:hypothetical protein